MPWCVNTGRLNSTVDSRPPPCVPVDVKMDMPLPTSAPFIHSPPVESSRALNWAGTEPYLART